MGRFGIFGCSSFRRPRVVFSGALAGQRIAGSIVKHWNDDHGLSAESRRKANGNGTNGNGSGAVITRRSPEEPERVRWPTVWGLKPLELHDRFWASRGIQVIRAGEETMLAPEAELFLLTTKETLHLFKLGKLVDTLSWLKPKLFFVKLRQRKRDDCREVMITGDGLELRGVQRVYERAGEVSARIVLTPDREFARLWQQTTGFRAGLRRLLRQTDPTDRTSASATGHVYDASDQHDVARFTRDLVKVWKRPDVTVDRVREVSSDVWADSSARIDSGARFAGPVWIGAGRSLEGIRGIAGPTILWDDPLKRPSVEELSWRAVRPNRTADPTALEDTRKPKGYRGKRLFDIAFSLFVLLLTLPVYPIVMLAIWLADGRPFFFAHRRESFGGKEFPCIKFRTMRKDAEKIKRELQAKNEVDGPQFFMEKDPRLLKFGSFLRKVKIDELPQLWNVLLGQMSIVGPRPSPFEENQYCPIWREARLSVRPGVTGLWQVMRTRRKETDFQEWIQYDTEYVEKVSWKLDLWILFRTLIVVLKGR